MGGEVKGFWGAVKVMWWNETGSIELKQDEIFRWQAERRLDASHLAAPFQRSAQGQFIRELEARARRQAMRDARNSQALARQPFGEIKARGVAFHVRAERDYHF